MQYNFEWDIRKAKENQQKHRVAFERASQLFTDPFAISVYDEEHSVSEDRWITIGKDGNNVTLVVVHTFRVIDDNTCTIRIISARRATINESRQYSAR